MMQLPPILRALCWCERKSNLYLLYDKNWNLRVLRWRDLTVSVQISHLTRARFKSCTPGVPFVSNSPLPGYGPLSNTRRLPGRGGGCHRFELNGAFYKRWTQSGVCTTITSSANAPINAAYYTKKSVSRWPSKPTYPSIGAREGFKLLYVVPRKISKALVSLSCQCV